MQQMTLAELYLREVERNDKDHFLHINPHTTHNSSIRSAEGLTLETSAL